MKPRSAKPTAVPPATDLDDTRARLIEAAGEVFAERGFQAATVREICSKAGANVAAVNYHFRDKIGLYDEVLKESLCVAGHETIRQFASACKNPEEALRLMISGMLSRMSHAAQRGAWHIRIMAHELAQPTEGLDRVIEQVIGPNYGGLRKIISQIIGLPPDHDTTRLCAHSVIAQVVHYTHARPVICRVWPQLTLTPDRVEQIAEHITDFSLAALRSIARRNKAQERHQ
jgi:TetR/AcrR family transcriptional regulator, regulator of cefoperazone and chloramphenicol sensitivity